MVSDAVFRHTTAACCPCGVHSPVSAGRLHMQPFPDREVWRVLGSQQPPVGAPDELDIFGVHSQHLRHPVCSQGVGTLSHAVFWQTR